MTELERTLASLEIEWPETPAFELRFQRRRRGRVVLAVALALLAAIAVALAVPPARSAILQFFHLRGATIERVETLPPARERTLRASLGAPITRADAVALLNRPFAVPGVRVYRSGIVVSALIGEPRPLLLSEMYTGGDWRVLKKFAGGSTEVEQVTIGAGVPALWIHGGRHVFMAPTVPPRYAGNTLLWQRGGVLYRLEGRGLTLERARRLAQSLR
jgi:hypothetical protein